MPELPEVETVRIGLIELLKLEQGESVKVKSLQFLRKDLRRPMPQKLLAKIIDQSLINIKRRAKYLLFETPKGTLLNHLGMTGYWREMKTKKKHDHFIISFSKGKKLVYNDPRRFGIIDYIPLNKEQDCLWLKHLGPEPLNSDEFTGNYLKTKFKNRNSTIKSTIMDQKVVVGVGNIYASEALFFAGIRPTTKAGKVSLSRLNCLVNAIQQILLKALAAGGSTISDFKQVNGKKGYFGRELKVYGRGGEACKSCGALIKSQTITGRSTFWCVKCQN